MPTLQAIQVSEALYHIKQKWKDYIVYHNSNPSELTSDKLQDLIRTLTSLYRPQNSVEGLKQKLAEGPIDASFQNSIIQLHKDFKSAYVFMKRLYF